MKIALIGAGAVGAYFVWGLDGIENMPENGIEREFIVVAEGERLKRLSDNGIKVNGKVYHPTVKSPEDAGECDVVVMAVKGTTIREASEMLPKISGENTLVMSMLNGVESEEIIAEKIGYQHVIHSIILIASRRFSDEVIFDEKYPTTIYYGAAEGIERAEEKLKVVHDAFAGTKVNALVSKDIMYDEWYKYARNITNNLPQAVLCAPAGMYTRSEHGLFLAEQLWQEVRVLAAIKGITLSEHVELYACADSTRYSTLQDIDNMRRTEVDSLCGYLMKIAKENNISVPYIEYTYHAIKVLEEKNEGLFD